MENIVITGIEKFDKKFDNMMKYKGYFGEITYDDDTKIFHGEVNGLKDIITFQGQSVNELKKAFQDSINDYLEWRGNSEE